MSDLHSNDFHANDFDHWNDGLSQAQSALQQDLSCLADGELDEATATRVMLRLEEDPESRAFFEDIQRCAETHRDVADPDRLFARLAMMTGAEAAPEEIDLTHRLASIFYKLGKAYLLAALQPDTLVERAFEDVVPVENTRVQGRGFVDAILIGDKARGERVDWEMARKMLNGRLERIEDPLEKARKLLLQAMETDPSHEESRFYLAYLHAQQGKRLKAVQIYQDLFDTAISAENRGHAAIQLGRLYQDEEDWGRALTFYRWVPISGLLAQDDRFWVVRFNIAMSYLGRGDRERALDYFRQLIDSQPDKSPEVAHMAAQAPLLRQVCEGDDRFATALHRRCPEMFASPQAAQNQTSGGATDGAPSEGGNG